MSYYSIIFSFKRGLAVFVTNRIPSNSPFKNYEEIRRHWKNTVSSIVRTCAFFKNQLPTYVTRLLDVQDNYEMFCA